MLKVQHINKGFQGHFKPVLKDVTFELERGDFAIVIGTNGSGKSTLFKCILGEHKPDSGQIEFALKAPKLAYLSQDVHRSVVSQMTLFENWVLTKHLSGLFYKHHEAKLAEFLKSFGLGLEAYLHQPMSVLSGGQRQLCATLMILAKEPHLVLLDEHTSALDPHMQTFLMDYTEKQIVKQNLTAMLITHQLEDALKYGNRLIMLHQGALVLDLKAKEKTNLTLQSLFELFHQKASLGAI